MAVTLREALHTYIETATASQIKAMHRTGGATFYVHEDQVRANDFSKLEVEYGTCSVNDLRHPYRRGLWEVMSTDGFGVNMVFEDDEACNRDAAEKPLLKPPNVVFDAEAVRVELLAWIEDPQFDEDLDWLRTLIAKEA